MWEPVPTEAHTWPEPPRIDDDVTVDVEITREWCKSCDICVRFCPERCLHLDDAGIAELTDPALCTGCRICEWLCPDFAIDVIKAPAAVAAE